MPSFANNPFGPPQQNTGGGMTAQPAVMAEPQVINPSRFTNYGQGNGGGFGGQNQTAGTMGTTPFSSVNSTTQQDMMGGGRSGNMMTVGQLLGGFGGGFGGQQQQPFAPVGSGRGSEITSNPYAPVSEEQRRAHLGMFGQPQPISDMQDRREQFIQRQPPQPMQQPGRPAFGQSPEYQGYQTQMQGLQQQMNDYMQKAPMYQQLQDLQGKMQGYQQRQQQAMQQQMMQRPSPFRRGQFQQPMGLMGLMGGRGGMGMASPGSHEQYANANNQALARASQEVKRPTMSRADFDARNIMSMGMPQYQRAMTMDMPQARGFESDYRALMKNGGKV
jgi:hypothetical protein